MVTIVQKEDPGLRKTAKDVPISDIKTAKIQKIIADMKIALDSQDDGVAIAAPQIGVLLRIFVVSKKVFKLMDMEKNPPDLPATTNTAQAGKTGAEMKLKKYEDAVFINPKIIKISKDKKTVEEGCLSVRWLYGKMRRASKAAIRAYNESGEKFERGGSGILAQIFQHEVDHLNGILFTDTAKDIVDMPPEVKS